MSRALASTRISSLILTSALMLGLTLSGCSKKSTVQEDESSVPTAANADENIPPAETGDVGGDSDSGKALGLQTVNFPYDSFVLDKESISRIKQNAGILKDKKTLKIQVEGHCDQRGGIQYNLALGEKRANSVRKYLIDHGIAKDRITTISFGKERPADPGTSEESYAKNRRANFVITAR